MSDQGVINLYINDLASTTHSLYQEKAANEDLTAENVQLKSDNASLSAENSTLKQEISDLQTKYDTLKSGAGAGSATQPPAAPVAEETPATSHF